MVRVKISTDNRATETTWELVDLCNGGAMIESGGPYGRAITLGTLAYSPYTPLLEVNREFCLPATTRYRFTIRDSFGDGICCSYGRGKYEVLVDGVLQFAGGEFGEVKEHEFGSCKLAPTTSPLTQEANNGTEV